MVQIPTQMDVLHNHTYTDISDFQHNETHFIENSSQTGCPGGLGEWLFTEFIVSWLVFFIAFPGISFALHKLRTQMRPDQVAPVYVTNLLISDLIQVCANPIQMTILLYNPFLNFNFGVLMYITYIYAFGVQVNVFFMMCISAERYVMVAHAVWYRNIQNRKISVIVSVIIWILSALSWIISIYLEENILWAITCAVLLLPYPLVMFFFVATWRALSRSSVPRNDQIRIRAILGLILCIYTILFIPFIITKIVYSCLSMTTMSSTLVALNPLFDLLLYVLIRKDISHVWRAVLFCCNRSQAANIANG